MASFAEYDEFGNYIGPDIDSDEDEEMDADVPQQQPLEGFEDDEEEQDEDANDMAVMQIGMARVSLTYEWSTNEIYHGIFHQWHIGIAE
jgi:116 kDa U5 small nuclear ribonucleoprotein component N-terminus